MWFSIHRYYHERKSGAVLGVIVWQLDLRLPMQSVPITTDVVSSNLDQAKRCDEMSDETKQASKIYNNPKFERYRYKLHIVIKYFPYFSVKLLNFT